MALTWEERAYQRQLDYQNQFCRWKEFPRTSSGLLKTNIAFLLFGQADDNVDYTTPMMSYHERYTAEQKQCIALIFNQIIALVPYYDIHFNFTYLCVKADKECDYIIFCCRSSATLHKTYFIEPNGRVYKSWQDFLETNKLPHCVYIAPQTGYYGINGKFRIYKSPAAQNVIKSGFDRLATVASIACIAGGMLSIAPVTIAVAGAGLGLYGVTQSIHSLHDRYTHRESMDIENPENFLNYLNIAAAGLTGLSSAAVSKFDYLTMKFGNSAVRTIKILNYATLACQGGFLMFNLYEIGNKINDGEISAGDAFNLTFQIFLMYGAVTNVRDMHQFLTQNSSTGSVNVTNKKLTKTQKRNLLKRRAKTRIRGQQNVTETVRVQGRQNINETVRVQGIDAQSTLKLLVNNGIPLARRILENNYPRAVLIMDTFFNIFKLSYDFIKNRIPRKVFWDGIQHHFRNLYTILEKDLKEIKTFFRKYFPNIPSQGNVEQVLNSSFDQVTQGAQDIPDMFNETIENVEITDESKNSENQIERTIHPKTRTVLHEKILDTAKRIACTCKIPKTTIAAISIFSDAVMFVTNELLKRTSEYETLYTKNAKLLGVEKARKMYEALGTKTTDDLILNDVVLNKDISNILNRIDDFHRKNSNVIDKTDTISPLLLKIVTELQNFITEIFLFIVNVPEVHGTNRTAKIIQNISLCLVQKLISSTKTMAKNAKTLHELNVEIMGEEITRDMLRNVGLYTDECEMFGHVMQELKKHRNDFVVKILEQDVFSLALSPTVQPEPRTDTCRNNPTDCRSNGLYIFMSVCDKLYRKMNADTNYSELEKARTYKRVIYFMGHKFLSEMKESKSRYEQLKFNIKVVGPNLFKTMLTKIGLLDEEHVVLLKEIADKLNNYERLKAEYIKYYKTNNPDLEHIKQWENTISDEGYTAYTVECYAGRTAQYYRDFASKLFKINIDGNARFENNGQVMILKSQDNVVIFNFKEQEKNRAFIILMDLRQITEQENELYD